LATVEDAIEAGAIARAEAEERLVERGYELEPYERVLAALEYGMTQVVAAHARGWPRTIADTRRFLDEVYACLDADPPRVKLPAPARRRLGLNWTDETP
jgi:hypothetical protein